MLSGADFCPESSRHQAIAEAGQGSLRDSKAGAAGFGAAPQYHGRCLHGAVGGGAGVIIGAALGLVLYYSQGVVTLSGIVVDEDGEPLIGATIMATGTTNGVVTDIYGHFTLTVPAGSVLVISYIGYASQVIDTSNQGVFTICMSPDM